MLGVLLYKAFRETNMFCWKKDEHIWLSGMVTPEEEEMLASKGFYNPREKVEHKWGGQEHKTNEIHATKVIS